METKEEDKDKQENFFKKPIFWFNLMVIILFVIGFVGERIDRQYKAQISKDFKRPR
ncbi:hypothetical protein HpMS53_06120 [Helicobacter pylori]